MGIKLFGRSSSGVSEYATRDTVTEPNPNPYRFSVELEEYHDPYLIAAVKYPDCTTADGLKIMVFKGVTTLKDCIKLDPHFLDGKHGKYEPIARFPADHEGARCAEILVKGLLNYDNSKTS